MLSVSNTMRYLSVSYIILLPINKVCLYYIIKSKIMYILENHQQ